MAVDAGAGHPPVIVLGRSISVFSEDEPAVSCSPGISQRCCLCFLAESLTAQSAMLCAAPLSCT